MHSDINYYFTNGNILISMLTNAYGMFRFSTKILPIGGKQAKFICKRGRLKVPIFYALCVDFQRAHRCTDAGDSLDNLLLIST